MTTEQIYDLIGLQLRRTDYSKKEILNVFNIVFKKAGIEMLPFYKGEMHLYLRLDNIPIESVEYIIYIARTRNLSCKIVSLPHIIFGDSIHVPFIKLS